MIRVLVPNGPPLGLAQLLRNDNLTTSGPRMKGKATDDGTVLEFRLRQPPLLGDVFEVTFPAGGSPLKATVAQIGPDRVTCGPTDDRGTFEPTFLIGVSADAFAPNDNETYPPGTDYSLKRSAIFRFDGQLRIGDKRGSWLDRLWLAGSMKYGVRSSDLDCDGEEDSMSPACSGSAFDPPDDLPATITATVLRASKIEAVFKPRFEFYTVHPDSSLPWVLYVAGRFGFGQSPDAVKSENIYSGGIGFLFPAGAFRNTGVETTWGVDRGYRTNPGGLRTRTDFRFVVGAPRSVLDQIPFISRVGQSMRALIEIIVDRNSFGPGPDGTQTFLGLVIDAGRLVP